MVTLAHHNCSIPEEHVRFGTLLSQREEARVKAIDSLARYKFAMFGYWAGIWVHLNQIIGDHEPSPFRHLVQAARQGK